tara:strand:+ start:5526 stop:6302 length:777 start_codon:yes stop_codon:yes gene_type:complete
MKKNLSLKLTSILFLFLSIIACSTEDGTNGLDGMDGIDGLNGTDGEDGLNSLVSTVPEEPGSNCTNGGFRLDFGLDSDNNGTLDPDEVTSSEFVCNPDPSNGLTSLISTVIEQPGDNCTNGGYRLDVGLDINNNGALDVEEVSTSEYLCNGDSSDFSYQSYASLISQTGTNDPTEQVLENSLNLNISWARQSQGIYLGTLDTTIDISKTVIFFSTPTTHTGVRGTLESSNQIRLELQNGVNVFADNFENLSFELREYE